MSEGGEKKPKTVSFRVKSLVIAGVVVLGLVIGSGFIHIVYGGSVGLTVCMKDGWTPFDTFVNVEDYVGRPLITLIDKAKVVRALAECGAITLPKFDK